MTDYGYNLGICDCGKWGYAPKEFNETKHFLKCSCNKVAYLNRSINPRELGLRETNRIELTIINQ